MIVRPATVEDAPQMTALLNAIIAKGGTTAHQAPFDDVRMIADYIERPTGLATHVAEVDGRIGGFQYIGTAPDDLPEGWATIASFVAEDMAGHGIGRALFAETKTAASMAGIKTIDATIRADNVPGLAYYTAIGFVDYDVLRDVPLTDGSRVDRIRKRFDL